jgi:hypothetical protein
LKNAAVLLFTIGWKKRGRKLSTKSSFVNPVSASLHACVKLQELGRKGERDYFPPMRVGLKGI